ncbi:MAG TPA: HD domain-containing phosphohydrolase [Chloroflexota bacterium]|jgi:putative nucleotidyltransferase with HDIG domain
MLEATVGVLAAAIDVRDPLTARHGSRLPVMAALLATAAGLDATIVENVRCGALLHDIGKIGVSDDILRKPGPLTLAEQQQMRRHPEIGAAMLEHVTDLRATVDIIRFHHEAWDGSGYPNGLAGEVIPVGARILAIVDAYDAMISPRPYRPATSPALARLELCRAAGTQFDPVLVHMFLRDQVSPPADASQVSACTSQVIQDALR